MKNTNQVIEQNSYERQYNMAFEKFQNGEISQTEWSAFCEDLLEKLMIAHSAILENLKNI